MMTPELNASFVQATMTNRHPIHVHTSHRPANTKEGNNTVKTYAQYLRYALSCLASVAFGLVLN